MGATRCLTVPAAEAVASPLLGFWIGILHPIGRGDSMDKSQAYNMLRMITGRGPIGRGTLEVILSDPDPGKLQA